MMLYIILYIMSYITHRILHITFTLYCFLLKQWTVYLRWV